MKKTVFNIGDKVRIINPEFFIRVGYPLTLKDAYKDIEVDLKKVISSIASSSPEYFKISEKLESQIRRDLAYDFLKTKNFGGNERKLHTAEGRFFYHDSEYYTVTNKKVVRTGTYDYVEEDYDDWDSDDNLCCREYSKSPVLTNQKTHVILTLDHDFSYNDGTKYGIYEIHGMSFTNMIESCNVLKYEEYIDKINKTALAEKLMR
jgi:hypothetical protein